MNWPGNLGNPSEMLEKSRRRRTVNPKIANHSCGICTRAQDFLAVREGDPADSDQGSSPNCFAYNL